MKDDIKNGKVAMNMGKSGIMRKTFAVLLSASLLIGTAVLPGCKKKEDPDPQFVSKHDSLDALNELKKRTEAGVRYYPQGEISKFDEDKYYFNSFHYEMKDFINALLEVDMEYVDDWTHDQLKYPVYEICLETFDNTIEDSSQLTDDQRKESHTTFSACWSDGYLITASGDVLKCDTDFEKLCESVGELSEIGTYGFRSRVFGRVSALWHDKWYPENMMTLSDYLKDRFSNNGMVIREAGRWIAEFKSRDEEKITVTVTNVSASELIYGEGAATVFTKIDGNWYLVPQDPSLEYMAFPAIGYTLFKGDSVDLDLRCGYLPKGEYAVLVDMGTGVTAEFEYELVEFSV